jgi:hypothetical protein
MMVSSTPTPSYAHLSMLYILISLIGPLGPPCVHLAPFVPWARTQCNMIRLVPLSNADVITSINEKLIKTSAARILDE